MTIISIGVMAPWVVDMVGQSCADTSANTWPSPKSSHGIGDIWHQPIFRQQYQNHGDMHQQCQHFQLRTMAWNTQSNDNQSASLSWEEAHFGFGTNEILLST